jgi:hypothetical protein
MRSSSDMRSILGLRPGSCGPRSCTG